MDDEEGSGFGMVGQEFQIDVFHEEIALSTFYPSTAEDPATTFQFSKATTLAEHTSVFTTGTSFITMPTHSTTHELTSTTPSVPPSTTLTPDPSYWSSISTTSSSTTRPATPSPGIGKIYTICELANELAYLFYNILDWDEGLDECKIYSVYR